MARKFEKVSLQEFLKYGSKEEYDRIKLPERKTKYSAGYDFIAYKDILIPAHESKLIPTGIKAEYNEDEVLFIIIRSSLGIKHNIRMNNQVGVIDSDYYNNLDNEGHIMVSLINDSSEDYIITEGSGFVQGIIMKYYTVGEEVETKRISGTGSTDSKEEK